MKDLIHDSEHAVSKLNGTIMKYDGKPYFIRTDGKVHSAGEIALYDHNPRDGFLLTKYVKYTDPLLSADIGTLGYLNYPTKAVFVMRRPVRGMAAGVTDRALVTSTRDPEIRLSIASKEFFDMLNDRYPSFDECLKLLDERDSVAFHRNGCLSRRKGRFAIIDLMYRDNSIGVIEDGRIKLLTGHADYISETALMELDVYHRKAT